MRLPQYVATVRGAKSARAKQAKETRDRKDEYGENVLNLSRREIATADNR